MQRAKGVRLWLERRKGRPAVYYIRDKERRVSTGCSESELPTAERSLEEYLTARRTFNTEQRDLSQILMADVMNLYATEIAPTKPSAATIGYHIQALKQFWGEKTLADVKGKTCRDYHHYRCTLPDESLKMQARPLLRPVSSSTARRELKTLSAAINHWHRESPLPAVPKVTLPEEGERRERVLERNEVARMLRAARRLKFNHVVRFILIGVYTGTRHAAILKLKWSESISAGHIDFGRDVIYRKGTFEKETSKRRPPVRIYRSMRNHLQRWKWNDEKTGAQSVIHYNGSPILKMKRAWAKTIKEAGLGKDVTPHVLRHTCASWLLWEGKTIWDVAGIIGADASTVQKVYGHHRLEVEQRKRA